MRIAHDSSNGPTDQREDENDDFIEMSDEVEIDHDYDVYEEDNATGDDSFSDEVDDRDADDIEDEIDHFYGGDGRMIQPDFDDDDLLL